MIISRLTDLGDIIEVDRLGQLDGSDCIYHECEELLRQHFQNKYLEKFLFLDQLIAVCNELEIGSEVKRVTESQCHDKCEVAPAGRHKKKRKILARYFVSRDPFLAL